LVDVTDVNPANVVVLPPNVINVEPIVTLPDGEPEIDVYGILVNDDPSPTNLVAVNVPVFGTKLSLESATVNALYPDVLTDIVG
jgi:hypothetical protein